MTEGTVLSVMSCSSSCQCALIRHDRKNRPLSHPHLSALRIRPTVDSLIAPHASAISLKLKVE